MADIFLEIKKTRKATIETSVQVPQRSRLAFSRLQMLVNLLNGAKLDPKLIIFAFFHLWTGPRKRLHLIITRHT